MSQDHYSAFSVCWNIAQQIGGELLCLELLLMYIKGHLGEIQPSV